LTNRKQSFHHHLKPQLFRKKNSGHLPARTDGELDATTTAESRVQSEIDAALRARQDAERAASGAAAAAKAKKDEEDRKFHKTSINLGYYIVEKNFHPCT
jgi:hypothetical protein